MQNTRYDSSADYRKTAEAPRSGARVPPAGAEIDLVIDLPGPETWAVEIKYGTAPKIGRHFSRTCDDIGASRKFVVYGGDDEFPAGENITIISLPRIMERLRRAGGESL